MFDEDVALKYEKKLCQTRSQHLQSAIEMSKRLRNNRAQQKNEEKHSLNLNNYFYLAKNSFSCFEA